MKIAGRNTIAAPPAQVWAAINDPAVLARTLPGCESLEVVGDGHYKATVVAGVASIRGSYTGEVRLSDLQEPSALTLAAEGAGSAGTIGADVDVGLEAHGDDATAVDWRADAVVGGMIGGVGQRMLVGVSRRMADEFFANLERDIVAGVAEPGAAAAPTSAGPPAEPVGAPTPAGRPARGTVFRGSVDRTGARGVVELDDTARLAGAFLLGAAVALAGVLVGRRLR